MNSDDREFRKKLLGTFKLEAQEHLTALVAGLMELEKSPQGEHRSATIENVFREAHSLKGAARAVNLAGPEAHCQTLESKFAALKRGELALSERLLDELHRKLDALAALLALGKSEKAQEEEPALTPPIPSAIKTEQRKKQRTQARHAEARTPTPQFSRDLDKPTGEATVRISTAKLDAIFLQAEELLSAQWAARRRAAGLRETSNVLAGWRRKRSALRPHLQGSVGKNVRVHGETDSPKPNAHLENALQYLEWEDTAAKTLESSLAHQTRAADQDARFLAAKVDGLMQEVRRVLMLPFASILDLFPKLVRDLSRQQGKEIELIVRGGGVEADKRILEEIKDPLVHLIRNAVDHGIEKPAVRAAGKKARRGRLTLAIAPQDAARIEVVIADDGAGIHAEQVRAAAVKQGIVSKPEADKLDEQAALKLIFRSGVSTRPILTDLSGRGLGLAIVREKVEKLGGSVHLETRAHAGTTFRMNFPVTLATSRGILVRAGEQSFLVPTRSVERVLRVSSKDTQTVESRETIEFAGRAVALVRLDEVLGLPRRPAAEKNGGHFPVLVTRAAGKQVAFRVDEIRSESEVLVKNPPRPFSQVRNMAGATVLGTGEVIPILNVTELVDAASRLEGVVTTPESEAAPAKRKSILVAEDSITARSLLKSILESAGYAVRTAVDGADALAALKTEILDLVVSDVDMPRLSGLDLTARVRADQHLAHLPVVLVTALESREDRERGIEVGADAYIVKNRFDQSNLLEIIRRLI